MSMNMPPDLIHTMRTAFATRGEPVEPVMFAEGVLRRTKSAIEAQLRDVGWVPTEKLAVLNITLGDPAKPAKAPVKAVVDASRWIAHCECGGAEHIDPQTRLFMCGACFNAAQKHRWRMVVVPNERTVQAIEKILMFRPNPLTRNWNPGESVAELAAENVAHGFMGIGDEIRIEAGEA